VLVHGHLNFYPKLTLQAVPLSVSLANRTEMADWKAETTAISGQPQKTIEDFDSKKKPKRNVYAIACAILASTTSILLGYGQ
jgi:hypothetical protein